MDRANLLDALPYLKANLRHAPADLLHRLLDLTQFTIRVHYKDDQATIVATMPRSDSVCILRVPPVRFELTLDGF